MTTSLSALVIRACYNEPLYCLGLRCNYTYFEEESLSMSHVFSYQCVLLWLLFVVGELKTINLLNNTEQSSLCLIN